MATNPLQDPLKSVADQAIEAAKNEATQALANTLAPHLQVTAAKLRTMCPTSKKSLLEPLAQAMQELFPKYGITSYLRICHFLAQAAHETDSFRTLTEYASGKRYEGRKDLGNVHKGDGVRYKGRGIFQLTGRANYRRFGKLVQTPLEEQPELAATPHLSTQIACIYWTDKKLSGYADKDDVKKITKRINGGYNGLQDRKNKLAIAKRLFAPPVNK